MYLLRIGLISIIFLNFMLVGEVLASPPHYCQKYIEEAAKKTGVLPEILWAVAKTESSLKGSPWPWTVNVLGKGYYFQDRQTAQRFINLLPKNLKYHVDIGCMQLNWGYHGSAFDKLSQMLNPRLNIIYAAYFLKELYNETGKWAKAIAHYHSRKWQRGGQYANRVAQYVHEYGRNMGSYNKGPTFMSQDLKP